MADQTARFVVELDATDVEDSAEGAAAALAKMRAKIDDETKSLRDMQTAMGKLKGNSVIEAKKQLQTQITGTRESLARAQASYLKGGGALDQLGKKNLDAAKGANANAGAQANVGKAAGAAGAESADAAGSAGRLAGVLGKLGPYVAAAAAILAVTVGLVFMALKFADTARSAQLANAAITGSAEGGAKLGGRIEKLAKSLPLAKQQLSDIAKALTDKGLQGGSLEYALAAVARTTAVLGSTAGGKIQSIVEKSKELKKFTAQALDFTGTGVTIDDVAASLAKRTKTSLANAKASIKAGAVDLASGLEALDNATKSKLGGAADKMNISLSSTWEKAQAGFAGIFAGLNIEPVLQGLADIVGLLDSSSASGKALRSIAETCLQPLLNFVGSSGPYIVGFFEHLVMGALLLEIGFYQCYAAVATFGKEAMSSLSGFSGKLTSLGTGMIEGLVKGIKNGAAKVVKALSGVIDAAVKSALAKLGINSPSKVFAEIGASTMEGMEVGIDGGSKRVESATIRAVTPPADIEGAASMGRGGGSRPINVVVNIHGVDGADDPSFKAKLVAALREALMAAGEPLPLRAT